MCVTPRQSSNATTMETGLPLIPDHLSKESSPPHQSICPSPTGSLPSEDLDFSHGRGVDRSQVMALAGNQWVKSHHNILVAGPTGAGKSYLACALAQKACRDGHSVLYQRVPRLLQEIEVSRLDGRYNKLIAPINKCEVLILDDLLISPVSRDEQRELLEIVEERYERKATVITSQLPVKAWHDAMQDPTLADAILDRLVHNAYKLELKGESMRRKRSVFDRKAGTVTE
jgi:DNA replication protein DnaC